MESPISAVMQKHVTTVDFYSTIDGVEETLNSHKLSYVPVVDLKGHCFGIISATDVVIFHSLHNKPRATQAWEVCSQQFIEASLDTSVKEAGELMIKNKIHYIVITENKSLKGIISSIDLEKALI
jgi:CBS domain-containing protein